MKRGNYKSPRHLTGPFLLRDVVVKCKMLEMQDGFDRKAVAGLLVSGHRRCCICHRFCGTKMETDHIVPAADSNDHSIDNAIPVCFDCHAEIHAYNPRHPRGRKFTAEELRGHKDNWLRICANQPEALLLASREVDSGPINGMLDELEHNLVLVNTLSGSTVGFLLREEQLVRAIREGVMSILSDQLRQSIWTAYGAVSRLNGAFVRLQHLSSPHNLDAQREVIFKAKDEVPFIEAARDQLRKFLTEDIGGE